MNKDNYLGIKRQIVKDLAKKLDILSDEIWKEKNWSNETMDNFLNLHERTPYPNSTNNSTTKR